MNLYDFFKCILCTLEIYSGFIITLFYIIFFKVFFSRYFLGISFDMLIVINKSNSI